ncbi:MAG: helix-turn-helix domain-containing protein [Fibrobacterota bacterium]
MAIWKKKNFRNFIDKVEELEGNLGVCITDKNGKIHYMSSRFPSFCRIILSSKIKQECISCHQTGGKCPLGIIFHSYKVFNEPFKMEIGFYINQIPDSIFLRNIDAKTEGQRQKISSSVKNSLRSIPVLKNEIFENRLKEVYFVAQQLEIIETDRGAHLRKILETQKYTEFYDSAKEEVGFSAAEQKELEKQLINHVCSGKPEIARKIINRMLINIYASANIRTEVLKARMLELAVTLSRAATEYGLFLDNTCGKNFKLLGELSAKTSHEEISVWIVRFLENFMEKIYEQKGSVSGRPRITIVLNYINENYSGKINVRECAAMAFLSESRFIRVFKEETGKTFSSYLLDLRLKKAAEILRDPEIKISETAYSCGFCDQSHLNRAFKKKYGKTPLSFKRNNKATS